MIGFRMLLRLNFQLNPFLMVINKNQSFTSSVDHQEKQLFETESQCVALNGLELVM